MNDRCNNRNHVGYKNYGGKGISVCEEWKDYFKFKEWALASGYNNTLTIDRIDNNKGYCPENCKWSTYQEQANNTSTNKNLTYKGRTQTLAEWCRELKLDYHRTKARINVCKMTVEEAFELKKYENKPK